MTAELYKNQLLEKGLVDTRASAITDAISELHKAFAACDLTIRNTVRDLFGILTVDQMITDFAKTEDLAKDIFDQEKINNSKIMKNQIWIKFKVNKF